MKNVLMLAVLLAFHAGCGQKSKETSVLQSIASTANETLIKDIENQRDGVGLYLKHVLENKEKYGLSDKEVDLIKENFKADDISRLVLDFIDPNQLRRKVPARWAFIPNVSDDSEELKRIEAVNAEGAIDVLDGTSDPSQIQYPIITLSFSEKLNIPTPLYLSTLQAAATVSDGGLMLNTLELSDVKEPWIKGAAEIYAVISYIGKDGKGASEIIDFPSVDKKNVRYDLRQIVHMWKQNYYQISNISFFEHDSRYDYSSLAKIFVTAASAVVSAVVNPTQTTTIAVTAIVSELANKVIDALPTGALTDDDDFADTVNTIEKYQPGSRGGVSGNAKLEMSFYQVKLNDE